MNEIYSSSGKKYNGEKAIISLTSWKARINTVSKTLFSLIQQCPGFHIVLVLSEEEFPQKEKELPENLMLFVKTKHIELLWVYKNYMSFKKVLFTIDKYHDVPVISADDDCIYTCNYAQKLYDVWVKMKKIKCVIGLCKPGNNGIVNVPNGFASLYSPNSILLNKELLDIILILLKQNLSTDDSLYGFYLHNKNIPLYHIGLKIKDVGYFHDAVNPISNFTTAIGRKAALIIKDLIML
jgi:hypothetical protein